MNVLIIIVTAMSIGRFLKICIYGIPRSKNIITIGKYFLFKAECSYCQERILYKYPVIEFLNVGAYLSLFCKYRLTIQFFGLAFLTSSLIVISFIDLEYKRIPNRIVAVLIIAGALYNIFNPNLTLTDSIIGFFAASVPMFILTVFLGGIGGGDIKLMAAVGIYLGWELVLLGLIVAACIASTVILCRINITKDAIPLAPFLSIGIFAAMMYGRVIITFLLQ